MLQLYLQLLNTCSEQEKFKQLYETYHRLMHWEAQRVLQDRQLAEDAVQESFLRMIKNFHKIGEISCPQTKRFVVIIVRNAARNLLAKESRLRSMQDFSMSGSADDEQNSQRPCGKISPRALTKRRTRYYIRKSYRPRKACRTGRQTYCCCPRSTAAARANWRVCSASRSRQLKSGCSAPECCSETK